MTKNTPNNFEFLGPAESIVGCMVVDMDNHILLCQRSVESLRTFPGYWQFPGGRVEQGESPHDAIRREVREETGLTLSPDQLSILDTEGHGAIQRIDETKILRNLRALFTIYLARLAHRKSEVTIRLTEDFERYVWVRYEDLSGYQLVPAGRDLLERLEKRGFRL